jgi:hypothetical protein
MVEVDANLALIWPNGSLSAPRLAYLSGEQRVVAKWSG